MFSHDPMPEHSAPLNGSNCQLPLDSRHAVPTFPHSSHSCTESPLPQSLNWIHDSIRRAPLGSASCISQRPTKCLKKHTQLAREVHPYSLSFSWILQKHTCYSWAVNSFLTGCRFRATHGSFHPPF